jgi:hypothetical protein
MNMGGLGAFGEDEAALMALNAGVDLVLHPSDPDKTASYLSRRGGCGPGINPAFSSFLRNRDFMSGACRPDFSSHKVLSNRLSGMAVTVDGKTGGVIRNPFLMFLNDDEVPRGKYFVDAMRLNFPRLGHCSLFPDDPVPSVPKGYDLIVAVFSSVKAWKSRGCWLKKTIDDLRGSASVFISFGNPYVLKDISGAVRVYAFWDSESSQRAVAGKLKV